MSETPEEIALKVAEDEASEKETEAVVEKPVAEEKKPKNKRKVKAKTKTPPSNELPIAVKAVMDGLNKDFGKNFILSLGDNPDFVSLAGQIPTGSLALDIAIGAITKGEKGAYRHGVPKGRIVEVYGPESCGKTTMCNQIIANSQASGGLCGFVDMEQAWDKDYAAGIGVNTEKLVFCQPECGEDALNTVERLIRTNAFDVLVVDSVATLVPKAEVEGSMDKNHVGHQARLMSQALRKLSPLVNKSKTCLIFTNQIREKIGVMFGNPETTSGGNALKFYATIRMDMRRGEALKHPSGVQYGHVTKIRIVKNKIAPPFRKAEFDMIYGTGIDKYGELIMCASDVDVITKKGSWYSYGEDMLGQGKQQAGMSLKEDPEFARKIYFETMAALLDED